MIKNNMKIINTQEELEALIDDNNNIVIDDDLMLNCDIKIEANIQAENIKSRDISCFNIKALNIDARSIKSGDIKSWNIKANNINAAGDIDAFGDIKSWNIKANNIKANNIDARSIKSWNIKANNIDARSIKADNILYFAVCFAYKSIICKSIKGRRNNSKHFVSDGTITETNNNL